MTEIATIDWFKRWGTSDLSENTAIFIYGIALKILLDPPFFWVEVKVGVKSILEQK